MNIILIGLILLMNFSAFECGAQTSKLPTEMPPNVEMRFSETGGMLPAYTKIRIANQTITVETKKGNERQPKRWTAEIEKQEQEKLYQTFVENKFDTIKNDERKGIVYDAGSRGVFINPGNGKSYNISSGPNSPLSGDNLKRYQAVANAIQELRDRYESKGQLTKEAAFTIIEYHAQANGWIFTNAKPAALSENEVAEVQELLKKSVADFNSKQKNKEMAINPDDYKLQFVPVLNERREKEVWVNGFCSEFDDWQTQIIQVKDGDKCFFNLYINLTTKTSEKLMINGSA